MENIADCCSLLFCCNGGSSPVPNGQQKILIKMQLNNDKDRSKVMKIASDTKGVTLVAKKGENQIEVVGNGIDSVKLTSKIRKKVSRYACLESLEEVKPKEEETKPEEEETKPITTQLAVAPGVAPYIQSYPAPYYMYETVYDPSPFICHIL